MRSPTGASIVLAITTQYRSPRKTQAERVRVILKPGMNRIHGSVDEESQSLTIRIFDEITMSDSLWEQFDCYKELEISPAAAPQDIRRARNEASARYHPDHG